MLRPIYATILWRCKQQCLAVTSFDVICRFLVLRRDKHIGGIGVFNDLAHQHEDTLFAGAAGLGHVVGYDQDRIFTTQLHGYRGRLQLLRMFITIRVCRNWHQPINAL